MSESVSKFKGLCVRVRVCAYVCVCVCVSGRGQMDELVKRRWHRGLAAVTK